MKFSRKSVIISVAVILGVGLGTLMIIDKVNGNATYSQEMKTNMKSNTYQDGTYVGSGTGFGPELTVEVAVEDNLITSIDILGHNEVNSMYYQPAFDSVPQQIIEDQNTIVDVVSGSTYSSYGIMEAVTDALSNALVFGELPEIEAPAREEGHGGHEHGDKGNLDQDEIIKHLREKGLSEEELREHLEARGLDEEMIEELIEQVFRE